MRWGPQRLDLVRYDRVEALSVGVRASAYPTVAGAPISLVATARLGLADLQPDLRLEMRRAGLERARTVSLYHGLAAMEGDGGALSPFASLLAFFAGRDDGDYYRRSGASVALTSAAGRTFTYRIEWHSEHHRRASTNTRLALPRLWDRDGTFRPNAAADEGWEHALEGRVRWVSDLRTLAPRFGAEVEAMAATGTRDFVRGSAAAHTQVPLPAELGVEVGARVAGSAGTVPSQRLSSVGGPATVRGHGPRARTGPCAWTARAEVGRRLAGGDAALFSDAGWAGSCRELRRRPMGGDDILSTWGVAAYLVDRVVRVSWGRAYDGSSERLDLLVSISGWR